MRICDSLCSLQPNDTEYCRFTFSDNPESPFQQIDCLYSICSNCTLHFRSRTLRRSGRSSRSSRTSYELPDMRLKNRNAGWSFYPSIFSASRLLFYSKEAYCTHEAVQYSSVRRLQKIYLFMPLIRQKIRYKNTPRRARFQNICCYLCLEKQSLQYTGRLSRGGNRTLQGFPQDAHPNALSW